MSDVAVVLTTTKYFKVADGDPNGKFIELAQANIPTAAIKQYIGLSGTNVERAEHGISKAILSCFEAVNINSRDKTVKIGSFSDKGSELLDYVAKTGCQEEKEFFKRFDEVQTLQIQFGVFGEKEVRFTVMGLWSKGAWLIKEISHESHLNVVGF